MAKLKIKPLRKLYSLKNVKVTTGAEQTRELHRRERKMKIKRLGAPGPAIKESDVPKSPLLIIKRKPRLKKGRKGVYGYEAIVYGRGQSSEPGKALYVTKKGFFENTRGKPNPITNESAQRNLPGFVKRIRRKYLGRLQPISIKIRYITKNESSDRKQHFREKRKRTK